MKKMPMSAWIYWPVNALNFGIVVWNLVLFVLYRDPISMIGFVNLAFVVGYILAFRPVRSVSEAVAAEYNSGEWR